MKKFEYKTIEFEAEGKFYKSINIDSNDIEEILNKLGEEGWELINTVDYAQGSGFTRKVILFLKREKQ